MANEEGLGSNFIKTIIEEDLKSGRFERVHTRFPPEPNGYLHIGHAKAITISYETAREFGGLYNLRFDDTNPVTEDTEYEEAIKRDIKWLGYDWEDRLYYASDYFDQLYDFAVELIKKGLAYVCDLSQEDMKEYRGSLSVQGKDSPYRERKVEENLELFRRMKEGEFEEGTKILRAKIDMSSPNMNMRDPVMYRILKKSHHRTGTKWVIYPSYDYAHGQSDSIEGITHSLCDISFENHRPLYEWFIEKLGIFRSRQIEFARLNLTYTITSKRFLKRLVDDKIVNGWDDPRMPTLIGMRRRGIPAEAIIDFMKGAGVSKKDNLIKIENFEYTAREYLKKTSPLIMAVLDPVKLTIVNYPEGMTESMETEILPGAGENGSRMIPFTKNLYVERCDFSPENDPNFYRLQPGGYVKLRKSYILKCIEAKSDQSGLVSEILCEYVPDSTKDTEVNGRKVKGIIHWLSQENSIRCMVRLYDRLFNSENPLEALKDDISEAVNNKSMTVLDNCFIESSALHAKPEDRFQFVRNGYFCADMKDSEFGIPVFNKTLSSK
jgi:glutaminyl-tRNA synthetase